MRVLVTGASGFVGSLLVPRLLAEGHSVGAFGRDPQRIRTALSRSPQPRGIPTVGEAEILQGDAITGVGLQEALDGVEVAYYLIHSMEPVAGSPSSSASSFPQRERIAAENFAGAAVRGGVRRVVYLGGLVPHPDEHPARGAMEIPAPISRHLQSREEVEGILLDALPDSLALRASIVMGARSRSFRLLVRLVERMPVLALPGWERFRTAPIDERDVIAMLAAAGGADVRGRLEVGGPDVLSYGGMLRGIAELMLVRRPTVRLRVNLTAFAGRVAAAIASETPELVLPLMEGLQGDLLPREDRAAERLGVPLHSFEAGVEHALGEWERSERLAAR